MSPTEVLRRHPDVQDEQIPDIIQLAEQLRTEEFDETEQYVVMDRAGAGDVAPRFLEEAVRRFNDGERKVDLNDTLGNQIPSIETKSKEGASRAVLILGLAACLVLICGVGAMAFVGATEVTGARAAKARATASLDRVLDAQPALVERMAAKTSLDVDRLKPLGMAAASTAPLRDRIAAAEALHAGVSQFLNADEEKGPSLERELEGAEHSLRNKVRTWTIASEFTAEAEASLFAGVADFTGLIDR